MKSLLLGLSLTFSFNVLASTINVLDMPQGREKFHSANFVVNTETENVWVRVKTKYRVMDEIDYRTRDVSIKGLSYDAASRSVMLEHEGQLVDCGTVVDRRIIIRFHEVKLNGSCTFSSKDVRVNLDNGYYVVRRLVNLNVK